MSTKLSKKELTTMDAYWRAANYLSVGQIYLYDNPLLKKPLKLEHIKPRLLGHWGTTPGLNFIYLQVLVTEVRDWLQIPIWKGHTARYTPVFRRILKA
jgi:xylulose-5-phosphate/fructose-6-phosphate phosphoketolase